jgi:hypothetical protein
MSSGPCLRALLIGALASGACSRPPEDPGVAIPAGKVVHSNAGAPPLFTVLSIVGPRRATPCRPLPGNYTIKGTYDLGPVRPLLSASSAPAVVIDMSFTGTVVVSLDSATATHRPFPVPLGSDPLTDGGDGSAGNYEVVAGFVEGAPDNLLLRVVATIRGARQELDEAVIECP